MKKYKTIFFDLDHTLWDFEMNSKETITELYYQHKLHEFGKFEPDNFFEVYSKVNNKMWDLYNQNKITKEYLRSGRFNIALNDFNVDNNNLAEILATDYLRICPEKKNLFPGAIETLSYLSGKYNLHIITNGFVEVQYRKLRNTGIDQFFDHIHISEVIGFKKPEKEIFDYAVSQSGTTHEYCIMIGDNPDTDIMGAINSGIDHLHFNPLSYIAPQYVKRSVHSLHELTKLL